MPESREAIQKILATTGFWPCCQLDLPGFMLLEEPEEGFYAGLLKNKVALTVFLRLSGVRRMPARQSNSMLEPTTPASRTTFGTNGVAAQQIVRWLITL